MSGTLAKYRRKRDFLVTSEPAAGRASPGRAGQSFVIQKHAASHLHYDLRLEINGVLKSWAVPKGMPLHSQERHLAIEVEDHPLDYASFEGNIPAGNYGAGTVMVWDRGHYELLGGKPTGAWKAGKLHLMLRGEKLDGEWTLVRTRAEGDKPQWLVLKTGEEIPPLPRATAERSVISQRTLAQIAAGHDVAASKPEKPNPARTTARKAASQSQAKSPLEYVAPMKPILADALPTDPAQWLYEIKFDGFRVIALKSGSAVELWSAAHKPLVFPSVAAAIADLPCDDAILDGEIVAIDSRGRSSFQLLQNSRADQVGAPICLYLFDLLRLDGKDLRRLDTVTRKTRLEALLAGAQKDDRIRLSANLEGTTTGIMEAVKRLGLEGVVAKRRDAAYHAGVRSPLWHKAKLVSEQDFVIGGFTRPEGSRHHFGALLVGCYRGGKLQYVGRVGTGFNDAALGDLHRAFLPLRQDACPFVNLPASQPGRWGQGITAAKMKLCTWIKPTLVCRVKFAEWTTDGALRHPVFLGLRDDKLAREVKRETHP